MIQVQKDVSAPSDFALAKCVEFVTSLSNYTGNVTDITFKTKSGIDYVHVGGNRHYPILVNESLYRFLNVLWTFATILIIVFAVVIVLSWLSHIIKLCLVPRRRPIVRFGANAGSGGASALNSIPSSYTDSLHLTPIRSTKFVQRYLHKPVKTTDSHFTFQTFDNGNQIKPVGTFIEIRPVNPCNFLNCKADRCDNRHIFHLYIPCDCISHSQPRLIVPDVNHPVDINAVQLVPPCELNL